MPSPEPSATHSRPTLAAVARAAAVAESTVSKVLNGRPGVSPELRERIERNLQAAGYRRRGGQATPGAVIALVVERMSSRWSLDVFRGVQQVASEHDTAIILTERAFRDPGEEWISGVIQRRPTGVILALSRLSAADKRQLAVRGIPFVMIDPVVLPDDDIPAVSSANWDGGWMATQHLVALGHRRIAAVTMPTTLLYARRRLSGYRAALDEAGIEADPDLVVTTGGRRADGVAAGLRLLALPRPPSAIVAGTDTQAIGLYEAARERGLTIPDDVSIVGYDDVPAAEWLSPPLTTIRQPVVQMSEQAARMLFARVNGGDQHISRLTLDVALVARGSTAPPTRA